MTSDSHPALTRGGPLRRNLGFTLIEMMIVIAIIGSMGLLVVPKMSSLLKVSINNASREIASIARESFNSAVLTGQVYRIAFDLKNGDYWVEFGPPTTLLDTVDTKEREARRKKFADPNEKPPPSSFALAKEVTRKKQSLPRGVKFEDVITELSKDPITDGTAYAHFFPHGISERTLVHLRDSSDHQVTLVLAPLMGRTKVVMRYLKAEDPDAAD